MPDWEQVVKDSARVVYRVALRILGNEHDAEDVAQDVFCEAMKLPGSTKVTDWPGMLRRMATLRAIDRLRRRRPTQTVDDLFESDVNPSHFAEQRELADRLRQAIARLPKQQAAVFSLAYLESLPRIEIAACLNISPTAVSTALYKAREKLKSLLTVPEGKHD